jgi:hypothetical protein
MLIVLGGLPGTGKTTIGRKLAIELAAVYLRIDSIEQSIRGTGGSVEGEGYRVAHAVAEDNLRLGRIVVADCVNPWRSRAANGEPLPTGRVCRHWTSNSCVRMPSSTGGVWKTARRISQATDCRRGKRWLSAITVPGRANGSWSTLGA